MPYWGDNSMTPYEIPLSPTPQTFGITLNEVDYNLTFRWNQASQSWQLDITDVSNNMIVAGLAVITGADLLGQFAYLGIGGQIVAQTTHDTFAVPTFDNLGDTGKVYFVVTD